MNPRHGRTPRGLGSLRIGAASLALVVVGILCCASLRSAVAETRLTISGFPFSLPTTWVRQETASAMRAAQFLVPNKSAGYDGIVIFYRFPPGMGGSADGNIARWYSQFKEPKETLGATVKTRSRSGRRLHYFRAAGTLIGRDGEMPDTVLHAALLDGPEGRVFVRFVAPGSVARANEKPFRDLVNGAFDGAYAR